MDHPKRQTAASCALVVPKAKKARRKMKTSRIKKKTANATPAGADRSHSAGGGKATTEGIQPDIAASVQNALHQAIPEILKQVVTHVQTPKTNVQPTESEAETDQVLASHIYQMGGESAIDLDDDEIMRRKPMKAVTLHWIIGYLNM